MVEQSDIAEVPKLFDDVIINRPSTLQQICIDIIGKCHQIILTTVTGVRF